VDARRKVSLRGADLRNRRSHDALAVLTDH